MGHIKEQTFKIRDAKVVLRSPDESDADILLDYAACIFNEYENLLFEPGEFNNTPEQERQWIRDHAAAPNGVILMAEQSGMVVGLMNCTPGAFRRTAHIGEVGITVRPGWPGLGLGTIMMRTFFEWAQSNPGLSKICLSVFSTNPRAHALYLRLGFEQEGRRERQFRMGPDRFADEILMRRFVD